MVDNSFDCRDLQERTVGLIAIVADAEDGSDGGPAGLGDRLEQLKQ